MNIRPVSGALGAEVHGVNPADSPSGNIAAALHGALLEHKVLFFRGDVMSPQQHLQFARIFGEPDIYPFLEGLPETPEVIEILKTEKDRVNFGGSWHSDTAYLPCPALGTVLQAGACLLDRDALSVHTLEAEAQPQELPQLARFLRVG